jgi:hypothetical protein
MAVPKGERLILSTATHVSFDKPQHPTKILLLELLTGRFGILRTESPRRLGFPWQLRQQMWTV